MAIKISWMICDPKKKNKLVAKLLKEAGYTVKYTDSNALAFVVVDTIEKRKYVTNLMNSKEVTYILDVVTKEA